MNPTIKPITSECEQELVDFLSNHYDAGNLYDILHHALGMDHCDGRNR